MDDIQDDDFIKYGIFPELFTNGNIGLGTEDVLEPQPIPDTFQEPQQPSLKRTSDFSFSQSRNKKHNNNNNINNNVAFENNVDYDPYEDERLKILGSQQLGNVKGLVLKPIIRKDPNMEELMEGIENLPIMTIESRPSTNTVISYGTRLGATLLLDSCTDGEISLSMAARTDLQKLVNCDDEFTIIDPPIVIYDTLSTGTCNIYCKEVVRLSIYLLACHLKCSWTVELFEDQMSNPKPFSEIQLKPYHNSKFDHAQPFKCEDIVMNRLKSTLPPSVVDEKLRLLQIHMIRLGHLTSEQACDAEFIQSQLEMIPSILNKQKVQPKTMILGKETSS
jgi:hypothetical protein